VSALHLLDPVPLPDGLGIPAEDWHQPPTIVRHHSLSLLKRVETLEARFNQDSSNSSRPPSTDSPPTKRKRRTKAAERRKPGAKPGHLGHHQVLLEPTASVSLLPEACACGYRGCADVPQYHTHQVIAWPVIRPEVTPWRLYQGRCLSCGTRCKSLRPSEQLSGYGPRLTGFVAEMAGMVGASRRAGQALWASVFGIPRRKGAIQKRVDRVSQVIHPVYGGHRQADHTAANLVDEVGMMLADLRHHSEAVQVRNADDIVSARQ
jgi:transposase